MQTLLQNSCVKARQAAVEVDMCVLVTHTIAGLVEIISKKRKREEREND